MNVEMEEKYFNYRLEPGRKRTKDEMIIDKPLISIVTPYYNCKKYITKTANSIFNQTFPYWEWIIYNDGSTEEGTEEVLNELRNKDSRITIMLMAAGLTILYEVIIYFANYFVLGANLEIFAFLKILLIEVIFNLLLVIIIYPLFQKFGYYIENEFKGNKILTRYF